MGLQQNLAKEEKVWSTTGFEEICSDFIFNIEKMAQGHFTFFRNKHFSCEDRLDKDKEREYMVPTRIFYSLFSLWPLIKKTGSISWDTLYTEVLLWRSLSKLRSKSLHTLYPKAFLGRLISLIGTRRENK